jgi:cold shock CspA family protein
MTQTQRIITNSTGTVGFVKEDRAFGFLIFTTSSGRQLRIYFHFADTDNTVLRVGDSVTFNIGADGQGRPRAYNVRFLEAAPATTGGRP